MSLIDRPLANDLEAARSAVNGAGVTVGAVLHLVAMREMQRDPNTDFIYRTPGEVGKPHYLARCPCCDTRDALAVTGDRQDDPAGLSCEHCGSNHAELLAALEQVNDGRFKLDVVTARQLCERPDPPASDELVGPLVVRHVRTVLGAKTGEGKSTFGLALVKAAVLGGEFLGFKAKGGARALVIDAEQGEKTVKRQLREAGLSECEQIDYLRVPQGLSLDQNPEHAAALEEQLAEGRYDVVLGDPLYKLHTGDSNDERATKDLMNRFDAWRQRYGFALILLAHLRKAPAQGARFTLDEFFGSGANQWGAEVVLGLQRLRQGYSRLHFLKDRDGDLPVPEHWGLFFDREQGFRRDPDDGKPRRNTADEVRELLAETPWMTRMQLMEATGKSENTVKKALTELDAVPRAKAGSHGEKLWALPPEATADEEADIERLQEKFGLP